MTSTNDDIRPISTWQKINHEKNIQNATVLLNHISLQCISYTKKEKLTIKKRHSIINSWPGVDFLHMFWSLFFGWQRVFSIVDGRLFDLLELCGFVQWFELPTHQDSNILDLLRDVDWPGIIANICVDHYLVMSDVSVQCPKQQLQQLFQKLPLNRSGGLCHTTTETDVCVNQAVTTSTSSTDRSTSQWPAYSTHWRHSEKSSDVASTGVGGCLKTLLLASWHMDNSSAAGSGLQPTAIIWHTVPTHTNTQYVVRSRFVNECVGKVSTQQILYAVSGGSEISCCNSQYTTNKWCRGRLENQRCLQFAAELDAGTSLLHTKKTEYASIRRKQH